MWDDDWARLGIEPTTELAAIKRAYALKLKVTRPDDNAEAYQALRGAYERAQQWVKWKLQEQAEAPVEEHAVALIAPAAAPEVTEVAERPTAPAPPPEQALELPAAPTPAALVAGMERHRLDGGSAALVHALPQLLRDLNDMPVGTKDEASRAFAAWVLQREDVPLDVLAALSSHFGWRGDYRAERALGPQSFELQAALDERMPIPITDPMVIAEAAPLLGLERLRLRRFGGSLALLVGMLCLQSLQRLRAAFNDRLLRALGLTPQQQNWLDNALMQSVWLRWLPALVLLVLGAHAVAGNQEDTVRLVVCVLVTVFGSRLLMRGLGRLLWWEHLVQARPRLAGLAAWRARQRSAWTGVVIVVAGGLVGEVAGHHLSAWMASSIGGLVVAFGIATLRWSASPDRSRTLAGGLATTAVVLWSLGQPLLVSSLAAIAALWTLLGVAIYERRDEALSKSPVAWIVRPLANTLALCDRWGWELSSWPLLATGVMALLANRSASVLFLWGAWNLAAFLLFIAQSGVDRACHGWLARQARAG